jgi:hypothetical protein
VKKLFNLTAAVLAAVVMLVAVALPPARLNLQPSAADDTIPGIIHVHTRRSDGRGTLEDVARAAARQGLKFVILTDHGDGTRAPDAPVYRDGVLCIDAVEISTTDGHYLALGLPQSPYPLNGEARDVVEDVRRLGGWGIVAHPESPKDGLSWRAWETPFDAIEWVNPDTSWRMRVRQTGWLRGWGVLEALAAYPIRPAETMARLIAGTALDAARWNQLASERRIVIVAGVDAHARLGPGSSDPTDSGLSVPIPSYDASFRTLSVHVRPSRALSGDPAPDAGAVLEGLRRGHVYVAIDGLASPPEFRFTAAAGGVTVSAGDELPGSDAIFTVTSNAPAGWTTSLWSDTGVVASALSPNPLIHRALRAGVYRVEIAVPAGQGSTSWIISNPIYLGVPFHTPPAAVDPSTDVHPLFDGITLSGWRTEHDPTSTSSLDLADSGTAKSLVFGYGLSGGSTAGQFAALTVTAPTRESYSRIEFSLRGERPGRLEVQVRGPVPPAARWQRSVYFDQSERSYSIAFSDLTRVAGPRSSVLAGDVRDILFVVETTHTAPGSSGRLWLTNPALEK